MFYERLQLICKKRRITVSAMLKELGLSTGSTGNWKKGYLPNGEILIKISNYLQTSTDFLLFGENKYEYGLTADQKKLLDLYQQIPDMAKYKILCDFEKIVNDEKEKLKSLNQNNL